MRSRRDPLPTSTYKSKTKKLSPDFGGLPKKLLDRWGNAKKDHSRRKTEEQIEVKIDEKTTVFVKPGTDIAEVRERYKNYKNFGKYHVDDLRSKNNQESKKKRKPVKINCPMCKSGSKCEICNGSGKISKYKYDKLVEKYGDST